MLGNNSNVSSMRSRACTDQNEGETQVLISNFTRPDLITPSQHLKNPVTNQKADLLGCGINGFLSSSPLQKSYFFFLFRKLFFRGFEDARNSVENELSSVPSYIVIIASFKVRYRKFGARKRYMPFDIVIIASFQMRYRQNSFRKRYMPFDIGVLASFQIGYRNF